MQRSQEISLVVAGQAGQGIESVAKILAQILKKQGHHIFVTKEYMSRVRGGMNSTTIRIGGQKTDVYQERVDVLVALDARVWEHCAHRITEDTLCVGEFGEDQLRDHAQRLSCPFTKQAQDLGNRLCANTIAVGVILGLLESDESKGRAAIETFFHRKGEDVVTLNTEAFTGGYKQGAQYAFQEDIHITLQTYREAQNSLLLSGTEALGFGALLAGCDFISSYPMSPSTGVLTFLAQHGAECGVLVEQATDEIGAINMALGASYAGARAMVTTSGGGFALMTESVSLAAMIETPIVIHIAQRPGPATGLPTRTAQEDLNLALYAGHGEFMRAIYAPGSPAQAVQVMRHAFDTTDQLQVPAIVLSDQYFVDAQFVADAADFEIVAVEKQIHKTNVQYKRYALTDNGVSPRGVPGHGEGFVRVDSDEHDEDGRITEDMRGVRIHMTAKRLTQRRALLEQQALQPIVHEEGTSKTLVISWGSNDQNIREALAGQDTYAHAHFVQIFPLHPETTVLLASYDDLVCVENNATGQFADLLERECGIRITKRIGKWNGEPFSVEELRERLIAKT